LLILDTKGSDNQTKYVCIKSPFLLGFITAKSDRILAKEGLFFEQNVEASSLQLAKC
jgi:hypothetical protein